MTPLPDQCMRVRCRCIDQAWIDAVVASKEAAQREREIAIRERDEARAALDEGGGKP